MAGGLVFARVHPKSMTFSERYRYQMDISANEDTQPWHDDQGVIARPDGLGTISVPYDGVDYVNELALRDIMRQAGSGGRPSTARISYLAFDSYERTDLAKALRLEPTHPVVPLDLPIGQGSGSAKNILLEDQECQFSIAYSPHWPEITPIDIETQLYDEEQLLTQKGVIENVAQQATFERSLVLRSEVVLRLEEQLATQLREQHAVPMLQECRLDWPQIISHRSLGLRIDEKEPPLEYDPQRSCLVWGEIPLEHSEAKANYVEFRTDPMILLLTQPTALYRCEMLHGQLRVRVPGHLLSGLHPVAFEVTGLPRKQPEISRHSEIVCDFTLYLEDRFQQKVYSPLRHLEFPGVILDQMRVDDIVLVLKDLAFNVISVEARVGDMVEESSAKIEADKPFGKDRLHLYMRIHGSRGRTTQETQIRGGKTFTTDVASGNMTIDLIGTFGDVTRVSEILRQVQTSLKGRFSYTAAPI